MFFGVGVMAVVGLVDPEVNDDDGSAALLALVVLSAFLAVLIGAVIAAVGLIILTGRLIGARSEPATGLSYQQVAVMTVGGWLTLGIVAVFVVALW